MPAMVKLAANSLFKPETPEEKAAFAAVKKQGVREFDYVTAMENIQLSRGMWALVPKGEADFTVNHRRLEDMGADELKVQLLSLGIAPKKQMTRTEVVRLIRAKLAEVEIVDDVPKQNELDAIEFAEGAGE